jgi:hypothetical protein
MRMMCALNFSRFLTDFLNNYFIFYFLEVVRETSHTEHRKAMRCHQEVLCCQQSCNSNRKRHRKSLRRTSNAAAGVQQLK